MSATLNAKTYLKKCVSYVADKGFEKESKQAAAELAALEAVAEAAQMSAFDMEKIHSYYSKYAPCTGSACGFLKHQKELTEALAALRKAQE